MRPKAEGRSPWGMPGGNGEAGFEPAGVCPQEAARLDTGYDRKKIQAIQGAARKIPKIP